MNLNVKNILLAYVLVHIVAKDTFTHAIFVLRCVFIEIISFLANQGSFSRKKRF